jgi:hypothetical protein
VAIGINSQNRGLQFENRWVATYTVRLTDMLLLVDLCHLPDVAVITSFASAVTVGDFRHSVALFAASAARTVISVSYSPIATSITAKTPSQCMTIEQSDRTLTLLCVCVCGGKTRQFRRPTLTHCRSPNKTVTVKYVTFRTRHISD